VVVSFQAFDRYGEGRRWATGHFETGRDGGGLGHEGRRLEAQTDGVATTSLRQPVAHLEVGDDRRSWAGLGRLATGPML
jgi:hypothetical protein